MDSDQQMQNLKKGMETCVQTVAGAIYLSQNDESETTKSLDRLREMMVNYIQQERRYLDGISAITTARGKLRGMSKEHDAADADTLYQHELDKLPKMKDFGGHEMMKKFENEVKARLTKPKDDSQEEEDSQEEDLIMTQSTGDTIDPITKKQMVDPVKNSFCGHSYERNSIMALIAKTKTRCPIAGCPNMEFISENHLIANTALKKQIQRKK